MEESALAISHCLGIGSKKHAGEVSLSALYYRCQFQKKYFLSLTNGDESASLTKLFPSTSHGHKILFWAGISFFNFPLEINS